MRLMLITIATLKAAAKDGYFLNGTTEHFIQKLLELHNES
jgi:hypothetical protein